MTAPWAVVTGASSGIGRAFAKHLDQQGYCLIITGRDEARLRELADQLHNPHEIVVHDLAEPSGVEVLKPVIESRVPKLLVNNAGFGAYGAEVPADLQSQMIAVNVTSVVHLTLFTTRLWQSLGKSGTVLNISSVAGQFGGYPLLNCYAATKAFLNHFGPGLDSELRSHHIRVLTACPGRVSTEFSRRAGGEGHRVSSPKWTVMSEDEAVRHLQYQLDRGLPLYTFNWVYRWIARLICLLPHRFRLKMLARSMAR